MKHFGGYDVHGAVKGAALEAAAKTQVAMKKMNIPDTDQHYAYGHLVYSKHYANYVWMSFDLSSYWHRAFYVYSMRIGSR